MAYVVAKGKSFVAKGQIFCGGATVGKDIFCDEATFKKYVEKKFIVEVAEEKPAEKKPAEKTEGKTK